VSASAAHTASRSARLSALKASGSPTGGAVTARLWTPWPSAVRWGWRPELGVAEEVARVAPHRPALRLVAEDAEARRVLTRPQGIGAAALEYLALLRARVEVIELPLDIAASTISSTAMLSDHHEGR
jgi:hypothetical protein